HYENPTPNEGSGFAANTLSAPPEAVVAGPVHDPAHGTVAYTLKWDAQTTSCNIQLVFTPRIGAVDGHPGAYPGEQVEVWATLYSAPPDSAATPPDHSDPLASTQSAPAIATARMDCLRIDPTIPSDTLPRLYAGRENEALLNFSFAKSTAAYARPAEAAGTPQSYSSYTAAGLVLTDAEITIDFSGVKLTIGTETKTYAQWREIWGSQPLFTILRAARYDDATDAAALSGDDACTLRWVSDMPVRGSYHNTSEAGYDPFHAAFVLKTTTAFSPANNTPISTVDLSGVHMSGRARVNGRGPYLPFGYGTNPALEPDTLIYLKNTTAQITTDPSAIEVLLIRSISSADASIPYLQPNSVQYAQQHQSKTDKDYLYLQELCKVGFRVPPGINGDFTCRLNVPRGVTVAAVRLPAKTSGGTVYADYDRLTYHNTSGGQTSHPDIGGSNSNVNTIEDIQQTSYVPGTYHYEQGYGGYVDLTFQGMRKVDFAAGNAMTLSSVLFQFVGTTEGITADTVPFGVEIYHSSPDDCRLGTDYLVTLNGNAEAGSENAIKVKVNEKYWADINLSMPDAYNNKFLFADRDGIPVMDGVPLTTAFLEDCFWLMQRIGPSGFPYSAVQTRVHSNVDGSSAAGGLILQAPVLYVPVPAGLRVADVRLYRSAAAGDPLQIPPSDPLVDVYELVDAYENEIAFTTRTLTASDGTQSLEIKLHQAGDPDAEVVLQRNLPQQGGVYVGVRYQIPADYPGTSISLNGSRVLASSWSADLLGVSSGSSYGHAESDGLSHLSDAAALPSAANRNRAVRRQNAPTETLALTGASHVAVHSAVRTDAGADAESGADDLYASYDPNRGVDDVTWVLRAGSTGERFRLVVSNGTGGALSGQDNVVYFILPHGVGWRTTLTGPPFFPGAETPALAWVDASFDPHRLTAKPGAANGLYTLTEMAAFAWEDTPPADWHDVTALRLIFSSLPAGASLAMYAPFAIPAIDSLGPDTPRYDDKSFGQTLYQFNAAGFVGQFVRTAALKIRQTDLPVVRDVLSPSGGLDADIPAALQQVAQTDPIPAWYDVAVYDDFTDDCSLTEIRVAYLPHGADDTAGNWVSLSISPQDLHTESYQTDRRVPALDVRHRPGLRIVVTNPTDYVHRDRPGRYRITYVTNYDADLQMTEATRQFVVLPPDRPLFHTVTYTAPLADSPAVDADTVIPGVVYTVSVQVPIRAEYRFEGWRLTAGTVSARSPADGLFPGGALPSAPGHFIPLTDVTLTAVWHTLSDGGDDDDGGGDDDGDDDG
ncbi:MAG: hypothetical protein LBC26_07565, partial [Oscillospiraceae bacterium]|nr:hypothetical protein [Oscillospiraceae bacterium]